MISSFDGEFAFLSNFWPTEVSIFLKLNNLTVGEMQFPTVEHAFQASKTRVLSEIEEIQKAKTPGQAKRLGRKGTLREDWNEVKLQIMEGLLRQKFSTPELRAELISTGDQELEEGNLWHDIFWGVCNCETHKGTGENNLGKLLMKIRMELDSDPVTT